MDTSPGTVESGENEDNYREKRRKPGIIYLSSIPANMNVAKIRAYFGDFGDLDRVFLQPIENKGASGNNTNKKRQKKTLHYSEGWIEFKSKRKAKKVTMFLNNQPVGGKKKNPYYDILWNIKYLPRFKWAFLKQRLEYEREIFKQRIGAEISQVRRETDHFIKVADINKKKEKKRKRAIKEREKREENANEEGEREENGKNANGGIDGEEENGKNANGKKRKTNENKESREENGEIEGEEENGKKRKLNEGGKKRKTNENKEIGGEEENGKKRKLNEGGKKRKTNENKEKGEENKEKGEVKGQKIFLFKQKGTEDEMLSKSEKRKKKNEMFRNKIAEKKKKKMEKKDKKKDDLIENIFVGGGE